MTPRAPAVHLMGPTGAGKTVLAVELVRQLPAEIVSVDAAMVYRGMDIGTAKPSREVLARAPHHLIDLIEPTGSYSAAQFIADALPVSGAIADRGAIPLFTGGTMLYFRALQSGLAKLPPANAAIRERLEARAAERGWQALHAELAARDPEAARRIGPGDRQRIQRALEVIELTGRPISEQQREDLRGAATAGDLRIILMPANREQLYQRLASRFRDMMRDGLLEELRALRERHALSAGLPAMRLIGYRQLWDHLEGGSTLEEAIERAIIATRQYARRQLTWLRAEPACESYDPDDPATPERIVRRVVEWRRSR